MSSCSMRFDSDQIECGSTVVRRLDVAVGGAWTQGETAIGIAVADNYDKCRRRLPFTSLMT
jgi:hypothetical protein